MIVDADTSPINYLILIGAIDVLPALYQKIVVPTAVYNELQSDATPVEVRDCITKMPDWFEVLPVTILLDDALQNLDEGEKQAITLFEEMNADALIIDERQGRAAAIKRGIFVIGTLGVLNSAAVKDLLNLPDAIAKLQKTSFRASPTLINLLLQLDIKRKQSK